MNKSRISAALAAVFAASAIAAFADVEPQDYYGKIAKRLGDMLPKYHVLQKKLDDDISQKAWTNLVTYYDFDHSVFLKSDLDALSAREKRIDDEIHAGDASFGFDVYNLYCRRLSERMDFVTNFLAAAEWDFSTNETYRIKRKDAPWPETAEEANEHWRRRLKNEVLVQVLGAELDKSTNTVDAAGNLLKKYRQYYTVLTEPDEEAVLQHYLSAVAMAYDPHSDYMSPASKEDFDMEMNLTLCGVGAVLQMDEGALKIVEVMAGGPVDRDGRIKEGDKIVGVQQEDGEMEDVMWKPMKKTIKKIRGKKGTRVTLEIVPRSDSTGATKKLIELVRDEIKLEDQAAQASDGPRLPQLREGRGGVPREVQRPGGRGTRTRPARRRRRLAPRGCPPLRAVRPQRTGRADQGLPQRRKPSDPVRQPRRLQEADGRPDGPRERVRLGDRRRPSPGHGPRGGSRRRKDARQGDGADGVRDGSVAVRLDEDHDGEVLPRRRLPSLLDSLDIGEDKLPNALPFSRILPADYARCWNLNKYVPELRRLAEARLEKDERYQKHLENVRGMKEISEREVVSLERGARKAQMAADRELRELDDDEEEDGDSGGEEKPAKRRRRNERAKDDVVLDSAFDVLYDLIRLNGGAELPRPRTNGGWFNSIIGGGY